MLLGCFKSARVDGHCLKAFCLQLVKGTVCGREMNPCSRSLRKGPLKIELLFACSTQTGGNYFKLDITQQVLKYFHYIEVNYFFFFLSGLQIAFCSGIAHFYFFFLLFLWWLKVCWWTSVWNSLTSITFPTSVTLLLVLRESVLEGINTGYYCCWVSLARSKLMGIFKRRKRNSTKALAIFIVIREKESFLFGAGEHSSKRSFWSSCKGKELTIFIVYLIYLYITMSRNPAHASHFSSFLPLWPQH